MREFDWGLLFGGLILIGANQLYPDASTLDLLAGWAMGFAAAVFTWRLFKSRKADA